MNTTMNSICMAPFKGRNIGENGFPCKGSRMVSAVELGSYSRKQIDWMKANKPLYFTGNLRLDICHLPLALRFD